MDAKETKPENQESKSFLDEMILEDFKTIESNADMIIELIQIIHRRAKQARQILEIEAQKPKQPEPPTSEPPRQFRNEYGGPWSNALRTMSLKAQRRKHGIKMRSE
jgi:hypothetical protein